MSMPKKDNLKVEFLSSEEFSTEIEAESLIIQLMIQAVATGLRVDKELTTYSKIKEEN